VGLDPAPCTLSNPDRLESVNELTIPSRTVEVLRTIHSYVDGYQDAKKAPKAGNDNVTVNQVPPALGHTVFCLFITADSPETNDSEGVQCDDLDDLATYESETCKRHGNRNCQPTNALSSNTR
jgi:hypothetical protein